MAAYYNEHDKFAAAWLRELIKAGLIADGEVDERSITDVAANDVRGFTQCHFFAGIGGWSYALRLAGWPDERHVWTGSCPCQPFSAAGKGDGFADERHLWPAWHWLIEQRRPVVVFGEQVESPAARAWLDLVSTDLEGTGYACGASDLPVAGVGAPGIRQRLFWVADREDADRRREQSASAARSGRARLAGSGEPLGLACVSGERREGQRLRVLAGQPRGASVEAGRGGEAGRLADVSRGGLGIDGPASRDAGHVDERESVIWLVNAGLPSGRAEHEHESGSESRRSPAAPDTAGARATSESLGLVHRIVTRLEGHSGDGGDGYESRRLDADAARSIAATGATRGAWADADWLYCRDETFRPVEPGTFPLAHGVPARVGRLRGYGNAINPYVAAAFIQAYDESRSPQGDRVR